VWKHLTVPELKGYLSFIIQSYLYVGRLGLFYSKHGRVEKVASLIPRERLRDIERNITFSRNETDPAVGSSGYELIRGLVDHFNYVSKKYYMPGEWITIDESVIPNRCRSKWNTCVPRKPHPNGQYYYGMSHADYLYHVEPLKLFDSSVSSAGEAHRDRVGRFVDVLPFAVGYTFVLDQGFGDIEMADFLTSRQQKYLLSCGKRRPSFLFSAEYGLRSKHHPQGRVMWKGETRYAVSPLQNMYALSFFDRKIFNLLTNVASPQQFLIKKKDALSDSDLKNPKKKQNFLPTLSGYMQKEEEPKEAERPMKRARRSKKDTAISDSSAPSAPVKELKAVPAAAVLYRGTYHGIDSINCRVQRIRPKHRVNRWFVANIFGFLCYMMNNAFSLHNQHHSMQKIETSLDVDDFIEVVCENYRAECRAGTGYSKR